MQKKNLKYCSELVDHYNKVLKVVAGALLSEVRKADVIARLGGEEFWVIMPEAGKENSLDVIESIRQRGGAASSSKRNTIESCSGRRRIS